MTTLLVTGAAGFIGSHYVRNVLKGTYPGMADAQVIALDKLTYAGNLANLAAVADHPRFRFVRGDVCDPGTVGPLVRSADVVVHFAAESHVDRSIIGPSPFVTTNVLGTQTMLEAVLGSSVRLFVHVSTDEVYGSIDDGRWTEEHPVDPNSPYSASKAGSELLATAFHRTYRLPVCITRCSNNYGPYQHPEKLVPRFVTTLLDGGRVPLYGDGGNVRDWLHVDDHCAAIQLVVESGRAGETYNIGGGTGLTNLQLTDLILDLLGADRTRVEWVPDRPGHDRRYALDDTKIRTTLGYRPRVCFESGLRETVSWYRDNRSWWST